jgi:DNA topoisomerase-3
LDERQVEAVSARIELDLRIGAVFTRMQCLNLQQISVDFSKKIISYGPCQFPTLGFVVDRYFRVRNFKPETFWKIEIMHQKQDIKVYFTWDRGRIFDRFCALVLYERCLLAKIAETKSVQTKPTSRWRPLPLTTVELQKVGSKYLGMTSQKTLKARSSFASQMLTIKVAEELYQKGFVSYPRTETDQFDTNIDLQSLIRKQVPDPGWGQYAQR